MTASEQRNWCLPDPLGTGWIEVPTADEGLARQWMSSGIVENRLPAYEPEVVYTSAKGVRAAIVRVDGELGPSGPTVTDVYNIVTEWTSTLDDQRWSCTRERGTQRLNDARLWLALKLLAPLPTLARPEVGG